MYFVLMVHNRYKVHRPARTSQYKATCIYELPNTLFSWPAIESAKRRMSGISPVASGGAMLQREEENENEVRREDQDSINKFARLNARLNELRAERTSLKKDLERLDDASTELMMGSGEKVMLMLGEAFFETSEDDATEHCEAQVEKCQGAIDKLDEEEAQLVQEQGLLKKVLYGRFGQSIQLEE